MEQYIPYSLGCDLFSRNLESDLECLISNETFEIFSVVDVTTLGMARKSGKLQKENPAGCAEEGK